MKRKLFTLTNYTRALAVFSLVFSLSTLFYVTKINAEYYIESVQHDVDRSIKYGVYYPGLMQIDKMGLDNAEKCNILGLKKYSRPIKRLREQIDSLENRHINSLIQQSITEIRKEDYYDDTASK